MCLASLYLSWRNRASDNTLDVAHLGLILRDASMMSFMTLAKKSKGDMGLGGVEDMAVATYV